MNLTTDPGGGVEGDKASECVLLLSSKDDFGQKLPVWRAGEIRVHLAYRATMDHWPVPVLGKE
jgi:hypothetical protein